MSKIWLLYSREHNAWWRPKASGYTEFIDAAGRYSKVDVQRCCNVRDYDAAKGFGPPEVACIAPEADEIISDLLAALMAALKELEQCALDLTGEDYNSPKINAAIAKATGND